MPADEVTVAVASAREAIVSSASASALGAPIPCIAPSGSVIPSPASASAPMRRLRANTMFAPAAEEAEQVAPAASTTREPPLPPGGWALKTIDERLIAEMLRTSDPAKLRALEPPREKLGTWMAWMACRVAVNDSELTDLNFTCLSMPAPEREPRIMRKLVTALGSNTHLEKLQLSDSNLRGAGEAQMLADSLRRNRTLRVLNIESNSLEPTDLQCIIQALASNQTLEELRCCNQFASPAGRDVFEATEDTLQANGTLCVLGMDIPERHYLDRVNRALIENFDNRRQRRQERKRAAALPTPLQSFRFTKKGKACREQDYDKENSNGNADGNLEDMRAIAAGLKHMMMA